MDIIINCKDENDCYSYELKADMFVMIYKENDKTKICFSKTGSQMDITELMMEGVIDFINSQEDGARECLFNIMAYEIDRMTCGNGIMEEQSEE